MMVKHFIHQKYSTKVLVIFVMEIIVIILHMQL